MRSEQDLGVQSLLRAHLGFQELGRRADNSQQGRNRGVIFYITLRMNSPIFIPTVISSKSQWTLDTSATQPLPPVIFQDSWPHGSP